MTVERLQKILSNAGVASRREAEELVLAGRVAVNGKVVTTLGSRADPATDEITVDGVPVDLGRYRYFALHKPPGFVTTASDEHGRETVLDLVPIGDIQLHPVGRLDMDSEGLIIVTNDGHLTDLLTHPRYEIEKEYLVGIDGPLSETDLKRLVRGIESEGDRLRATSARPAMAPPAAPGEAAPAAPAWLVLTLREGKKREIRRMMEALGRRVRLLRRIRIGPLHLGALGSGSFRELEQAEVLALYASAKQLREQADGRATPRKPMEGGASAPTSRGKADTPRPRTAAPMPPKGTAPRPPRPAGGRAGSRQSEPRHDDEPRGQRVRPPEAAPRGARRPAIGGPGGPARGARGSEPGSERSAAPRGGRRFGAAPTGGGPRRERPSDGAPGRRGRPPAGGRGPQGGAQRGPAPRNQRGRR